MISVFLVNDKPLGITNPSSVKIAIQGVTSDANRTADGNIKVLNKVNSIPTIHVDWDVLSISEMEKLCSTFKIEVADFEGIYNAKKIKDLVFKITVRLPCGIRSFSAYVGDTLEAELIDRSENKNDSEVGGEYWRNVRLSLIGTGEKWR